MNKTELVAAMAKETNLSKKDVEAVLKSFVDVVSGELKKGEKVQLVGFGSPTIHSNFAFRYSNLQIFQYLKMHQLSFRQHHNI